MSVASSKRKYRQRKNFAPSEIKKIVAGLLKISKNEPLKDWDMKDVPNMMIVDHRQLSRVWKQYQITFE